MTGLYVRLKGLNVGKARVVHEVQVRSAEQQQSIESALLGINSEFVWSYRSNDKERGDTLCDIFD